MHYLILILVCLFTLPTQAAEPLKVTYGLYAGGFNVVDMKGTYDLNEKAYNLEMDLKTAGLLGKLAPWSGIIKSHGKNTKTHSIPAHHSFASTWRQETKTNIFNFSENGSLLSYKIVSHDGTEQNKMPAKEVYADRPVDMLTALFRAMRNKTCATTQPALDGKRRFDMAFRSKGEALLKKTKYSVFEGKAEICELEIMPVAGKWREKPRGWMSIQGQAKKQGQLPQMWFGKVRDDMPSIPVRFQIKTDYGTMIMHLKSID